MSKKEQFNRAFSQINDEWIEWAAIPPKNKKTSWKKWGTLAIAVSILLCISIGVFTVIYYENIRNNATKSDWKIIYSDDAFLKKTKTGINGFNYTLCISYAPIKALSRLPLNFKSEEDICAEMFGQWTISQLSFDYEQHFSLFHEEFVNEKVYKHFQKSGYTPEQATKKISQVAADVVGFTDYRFEYSVLEIKNTPELLTNYRIQYQDIFQRVGLNTDYIEEVCEYTFKEVNIYYNDMFLQETSVSDIVFYKYDGKWYISPNEMEDDLCIDLVQTEKNDSHVLYDRDYMVGEVEKIENGYAVLFSTYYFLIKEHDIAVGDFVYLEYYSLDINATRITDGEQCKIAVIAYVKKFPLEDLSKSNKTARKNSSIAFRKIT